MAQRQWRSDDTSIWTDKFGTGSDGAYAPSTGTDAPIDSACTGTINTISLSATNASFAIGQLILIHQTRGTGAGQWELNKIAFYTAGTITTSYPLIYGYVSGAQVLVMPQYSSGLIDTGVTITGKAWNGTVGGIYAKFCNGTFTITGSLTLTGVGFAGGAGRPVGGNSGYQGDGTVGTGAISTSANGNGAGGAQGNSSGGGGSYITSGSAGANVGATPGSPGNTVGIANLTTIIFGGGGGSGGNSMGSGISGVGGIGGGILLIIAKTINIANVVVNGQNGGPSVGGDSGGDANGGAGAGGAILLKGQILTLGSGINAIGGTGGGTNSQGGNGGNGGIHADYSLSISGTTTPTIDSTLDTTITSGSSGSAFFNFF